LFVWAGALEAWDFEDPRDGVEVGVVGQVLEGGETDVALSNVFMAIFFGVERNE